MSENIPHSLGGFRGAFESEHGRKPTDQEIWNAAIRSWRDLNQSESNTATDWLAGHAQGLIDGMQIAALLRPASEQASKPIFNEKGMYRWQNKS